MPRLCPIHLAVANFGAYTFAPPIMVAPLGALSVIVAAVFASFLLNERLGYLGHVGCTLCILGSSIIVLHAPEDQELETVIDASPFLGFLFYFFTVLIFSLIMAYDVAPRHGRTNPLVYISIASLVSGVSVMFVKGLSVALKLAISGENQSSTRRRTWFNTPSASSTVSLLSGFIVTFLGVHILSLAMLDESEAASRTRHPTASLPQHSRVRVRDSPLNPMSPP
ncbi:magnesium transporter NIPA-domain-containing protein [Mycena leptocephala]|nr:magnesium transporter NIPA-domain-containing protein [Mycena leptocephala]